MLLPSYLSQIFDSSDWDPFNSSKRYVYRGQSWNMAPSSRVTHMLGKNGTCSKREFIDHHVNLIKAFKTIKRSDDDDLRILETIHQNGGPTCLIDYTTNILVALWFATRKNADSTDGELYYIDTEDIECEGDIRWLTKDLYENLNRSIEQLLIHRDFNRKRTETFWIWEPSYNESETSNNQCLVYFFGLPEMKEIQIKSVPIPHAHKDQLRHELEKFMGISQTKLFADIKSFSVGYSGKNSILEPEDEDSSQIMVTAKSLEEQRKFEGAIKLYSKLLRANKPNYRIYRYIARCYAGLHKAAKLDRTDCPECVGIDNCQKPCSSFASESINYLQMAIKNCEAYKVHPKYLIKLRNEIAVRYLECRKFDDAINEFNWLSQNEISAESKLMDILNIMELSIYRRREETFSEALAVFQRTKDSAQERQRDYCEIVAHFMQFQKTAFINNQFDSVLFNESLNKARSYEKSCNWPIMFWEFKDGISEAKLMISEISTLSKVTKSITMICDWNDKLYEKYQRGENS